MKRVQGHSDLLKDAASGVVINTNRDAYTRYKRNKNARLHDKKRISELEERLGKMESLLERLIDGRS